MPKGDVLWCDLSTFHVEQTKSFYATLFGWSYAAVTQPGGSPYHLASTAAGESAAIFEMPQKFRTIGLPSFWMSYIAVDDIDAAVDEARRLGGKVEVGAGREVRQPPALLADRRHVDWAQPIPDPVRFALLRRNRRLDRVQRIQRSPLTRRVTPP